MRRFLPIFCVLSALSLSGCGDSYDADDYDEDDAYEDGLEGVLENEAHHGRWCEGLARAIRSGNQPKTKWDGSGCGSMERY